MVIVCSFEVHDFRNSSLGDRRSGRVLIKPWAGTDSIGANTCPCWPPGAPSLVHVSHVPHVAKAGTEVTHQGMKVCTSISAADKSPTASSFWPTCSKLSRKSNDLSWLLGKRKWKPSLGKPKTGDGNGQVDGAVTCLRWHLWFSLEAFLYLPAQCVPSPYPAWASHDHLSQTDPNFLCSSSSSTHCPWQLLTLSWTVSGAFSPSPQLHWGIMDKCNCVHLKYSTQVVI